MSAFQHVNVPDVGSAGVAPPEGAAQTAVKQTQTSGEGIGHSLQQEGQQTQAVEIVVSGPLSQVYTAALNTLLARSGQPQLAMENMGSYVKIHQEVQASQAAGEPAGAFVYVADGDSLDIGDAAEIFQEIVNYQEEHPGSEVVLGLESAGNFSKGSNLLIQQLKGKGVKIGHRRDAVVGNISRLGR